MQIHAPLPLENVLLVWPVLRIVPFDRPRRHAEPVHGVMAAEVPNGVPDLVDVLPHERQPRGHRHDELVVALVESIDVLATEEAAVHDEFHALVPQGAKLLHKGVGGLHVGDVAQELPCSGSS